MACVISGLLSVDDDPKRLDIMFDAHSPLLLSSPGYSTALSSSVSFDGSLPSPWNITR